MKDVVATNEDKKLESEEDLDQHFGIPVEMEKFSEHIVENKEEVKDVVATNEEKKLEAEEDLDQHCDISVEWKWKSSVLVINEEEVKVATIDDNT